MLASCRKKTEGCRKRMVKKAPDKTRPPLSQRKFRSSVNVYEYVVFQHRLDKKATNIKSKKKEEIEIIEEIERRNRKKGSN